VTTTPASDVTSTPLTTSAVLALAAIATAANRGARVGRLMPDWHPLAGAVVRGTARHLVTDERALFPNARDDIRACMLRVTGEDGMDHFWPLAELVAEYHDATFCTDIS